MYWCVWSTAAKTLLLGDSSFSLKTPATKPTEAGASGSVERNTWSVRCDCSELLGERRRADAHVFLHEVAAGLDVVVGRDVDFQLPQTALEVCVDTGQPGPRAVAEGLFLLPREERTPGKHVGSGRVAEIDAHLRVLQSVLDLDLQRTVLVDTIPHLAACGGNDVGRKVAHRVDRGNGGVGSLFLISIVQS